MDGGSLWESNPPFPRGRGKRPVLKAETRRAGLSPTLGSVSDLARERSASARPSPRQHTRKAVLRSSIETGSGLRGRRINDDVVEVERTGEEAAATDYEALDASHVDRQRANRVVALNDQNPKCPVQ